MTKIIEWIKVGIVIGIAIVELFVAIIFCPIFVAIQMYKDKKDGKW